MTTVERTFPIVEIFGPTLQGEGTAAGMRSHFVRFGYCDALPTGPCRWCDSMFAVDPKHRGDWTNMTTAQVLDRLKALGGSKTVTLSGGNPCIYRLDDLVAALVWEDWTVWVETQGSIYREWLDGCHVTVSPKPPSAGRCDRAKLATFVAKRAAAYPRFTSPRWSTIKIPIDPAYNNGVDFVFAESVLEEFKSAPFAPALSVVTYSTDTATDIIDRWRAVAEWAIDAPISDRVRTLPQLHVLLWSHARGV
jgi:7-carboxy-7-deazaguanine synthase